MKNIDEIKSQIDKEKKTINVQQNEMQEIRHHIIDAAKPFLRELIEKEVNEQVKSDPEHTKEIGIEKLTEMKQEFMTLLANSDRIVDEIFSEDSFWIHTGYMIKSGVDQYVQLYENKKAAEERINKGFRAVVGKAGQLLKDNGYLKSSRLFQRPYNHVGMGLPVYLIYQGYLPVPDNIKLLQKQYIDKLEALHNSYHNISRLERELSEQEAADLWNQV